jgi:hypothetical protein
MPHQDEMFTVGAVSMPGSAPFPCLIMYPYDAKLGFAQRVNDTDAAREKLRG